MEPPAICHPVLTAKPVSPLPSSPAVGADGLIFVSGRTSTVAGAATVRGSFKEEFHRSRENARLVLEAANRDLPHAVQTRDNLQNSADLPLSNKLHRSCFPPPFPARTTLLNCLAEVPLFEVKVFAVPKAAGSPGASTS